MAQPYFQAGGTPARVVVIIWLDAVGDVTNASIGYSSGNPIEDHIAILTAQAQHYMPRIFHCSTTVSAYRYVIDFNP